jgi:EpsI family protein
MFLLLCFIVPIIANGFRAFGIVYIAYLSNNELAVGVDHIVYGWVFFAIVTLILLSIGMTFRDAPAVMTAPHPEGASGAGGGGAPRRIAGITVAALFAALIMPAYAALIDIKSPPSAPATLAAPAVGGGWAAISDNRNPDWSPIFTGADRTLLRSYVKNGQRVDIFLAYYTRERQGAELISTENRLADEKRWSRASSHAVSVRVDGTETSAIVTRIRDRSRGRLVLYWYWIGGRFTANPYVAKALQALDRLRGGSPAAAVALSAVYDDQPAEAEALIRDFLASAGAFAPVFRVAAGR